MSTLAPPAMQIYLTEDPYQLQKEKEVRPMKNLKNQDKDQFDESLLTPLNGKQDLNKQSFNMIQDMTCRHEYDNLMRDISIYDGKNMDLADWLLQLKKLASLTHSKECKLATANSTSTPYRMLKRLGNDLDLHEIKRKLEEVYSPIATEIHAASDLHHKQMPDKILQNYIQIFTNLTEKAIGTDPANITNRVIIFLFIKNLYNKEAIAGSVVNLATQ